MEPFSGMMDERVPLKVIKSGYINLDTVLVVAAGTVLNRKRVLTRTLPEGKLRFVLQWNDLPKDLDLHLKSSSFHISYRNMKDLPSTARLDRDEMQGYGPETITLDKVDPNAVYSLWVDVYSSDDVLRGNEDVLIYAGDKLVNIIQLPATRKPGVHILDIVRGKLVLINKPSGRP